MERFSVYSNPSMVKKNCNIFSITFSFQILTNVKLLTDADLDHSVQEKINLLSNKNWFNEWISQSKVKSISKYIIESISTGNSPSCWVEPKQEC